MPFLSSVSGSKGGRLFGLGKLLSAPAVTMLPITNYSAFAATFKAEVNRYDLPYDIKFQISTDQSAWYDCQTITNSTSSTPYSNETSNIGFGTTYYVRAIATNSVGSTTSNTVSFTSWSQKTFIKTTSGSYSVTIPAFTPEGGGTPSTVNIDEVLLYGGGGGANYSGGGGGGYRINHQIYSTVAGTQVVSGYVGAGGAGGNGGSGSGGAQPGGDTTLTFGTIERIAGGGYPADWLTRGGRVGSGNNTSNDGGTGNYGYTYVSGYNQWTDPSCGCCVADKYGNCTGYCTCNNPSSPIYATDNSRYAGGGGGGTDAVGGASTYPDGGANGGAGGGAYGLRGGNGGRGGGTATFGSDGSTSGSGPVVGTGGSGWFGAGVAGGVTFKYYGP